MTFALKYEISITLNQIPIQWIPKIELFYPDLPQFPIIYVHSEYKGKRIYGCPVAVNYAFDDSQLCSATFIFLCNQNAVDDSDLYNLLKDQLAERIGLSDKITYDDIINCCNGNNDYEFFFSNLWNFISKSYGEYIPYGQFFEEIYSIIRFVSAWQPKTGRQSEMRMLYNFMSIFGSSVDLPNKWNYLEFYLIPNYNDSIKLSFSEFTEFNNLFSSIQKIWKSEFTNICDIAIDSSTNYTFKTLKKAWPQNKDDFMFNISEPLYKQNIININEKYSLERLVDAFNRHSWRAAFFISSFMNINNRYKYDYCKWSKDFFISVYDNGKKLKGYSEKVIACFLQQGFKQKEIIPIDTWIETFYKFPLNINEKKVFFSTFNELGKLERVIWLSSQSNKTNMKNFFNMLWCQRYGTRGNSKIRGANPISCYECALKKSCLGYKNIEHKSLLLFSDKKVATAIPNIKSYDFLCEVKDNIPKKIYTKNSEDLYDLIDEFSGFILTKDNSLDKSFMNNSYVSTTVSKFISNLPPYKF
ncbi:hypothetical protein ACQR2L_05045 [Clostridium butyricum]|uniref:hypothetical protein n=1 Tax=Clostridium butyricum TaxID=1492 RepID=UPI003D0F1ECE